LRVHVRGERGVRHHVQFQGSITRYKLVGSGPGGGLRFDQQGPGLGGNYSSVPKDLLLEKFFSKKKNFRLQIG